MLPAQTGALSPAPPDYLDYDWHRHVGNGGGEYEDYTDDTNSHASLQIVRNDGSEVVVRSAYNWTYGDNEGGRQSGTVDRLVTFNLATRRWTSQLTDDDDHDTKNASLFYEWFWVPPGMKVGDQFGLVDDMFVVTSLRTTIWSAGLPKIAVELTASGTFSRTDEYGIYSVSYRDAFYFDQATGYVVAERYTEHDYGTYLGSYAEFTWTEELNVVRSSYPIEVDWPTYYVFLGQVGATLAFLGLAAYAWRWRPRSVFPERPGFMRMSRLKRMSRFPALPPPPAASPMEAPPSRFFYPFLRDFAKKGILARDRVAVVRKGGVLEGLAIYSRDAKVGQVFAAETPVAERLRAFIGAKDFFSEYRHPAIEEEDDPFSGRRTRRETRDAYNIFDEYLVLRLDRFPSTSYDGSLVSRMKEADLPAVAQIAEKVYGARSDRWLRAQLASGDIGFVARVDGAVVGFAFASFSQGAGRLHTVTVLPDFRGRGIGRELVRARLHALEALGAQYVLTEIAKWNLASLELAYSHGFAMAGAMWVETTKTRRTPRRLFRR